MHQENLFDIGPGGVNAYGRPRETAPRVATSATSRDAAERIEPVTGALRKQVYEFLRSRGADGATDEEIIAHTKLSPSTARPRRIECVERGLVKDSGRTRPTTSGRKATVWIVTGEGG